MGLFKSIAGAAVNPLGIAGEIGAKKLFGKNVGDMIGGALGLDKDAPQFNPDLRQVEADIQKVRDLRDKEITDVRQSAKIGLDRAGEDLQQSLGQIQAGTIGRFGAMQDAIASSGGLDSGTTERLARNAQREGVLGQQSALSEFGDLRSDIRMGDFAAQEALQNQALFAMPQLSTGVASIQNAAAAANMQAKALMDANNQAKIGNLGSLAGGAIGFGLGGPMGGMIGMGAGKGLFSMLG